MIFLNFLKRNLRYVIIFAVIAAALIVGTFCDLGISEAIATVPQYEYYSSEPFAVIIEIFGEMPIYIISALALGCILFYVKKSSQMKQGLKTVIIVSLMIAVVGVNYYGCHKLIGYLGTHVFSLKLSGALKIIAEAALAIAFSALWLFLTSRIKPYYLKSLAICSLIVILTAVFSQITAQGLKLVFGRARYRLLVLLNDFSEYTPWYSVNIGKTVTAKQLSLGAASDAYKSFPSGHTAAAAMVFTLMSLPYVFNISKRDSRLITAACCLLVFIVGCGRILMGAHYLSDVAAGAAITLAWYVASQSFVFKIIRKTKD